MKLRFDISVRSHFTDTKEEIVMTEDDLTQMVESAIMEKYEVGDVTVMGVTFEPEEE